MRVLLILGMIFSFVFGEIGKITALIGDGNIKRGGEFIPLKLGLKI